MVKYSLHHSARAPARSLSFMTTYISINHYILPTAMEIRRLLSS